ncbi:MAG: hypothetical protein HN431_01680 [Bacteroidetes bacterium]|jgi:hypothetical protein|nr:hypothetical protein [Bacteroidota bacterium]
MRYHIIFLILTLFVCSCKCQVLTFHDYNLKSIKAFNDNIFITYNVKNLGIPQEDIICFSPNDKQLTSFSLSVLCDSTYCLLWPLNNFTYQSEITNIHKDSFLIYTKNIHKSIKIERDSLYSTDSFYKEIIFDDRKYYSGVVNSLTLTYIPTNAKIKINQFLSLSYSSSEPAKHIKFIGIYSYSDEVFITFELIEEFLVDEEIDGVFEESTLYTWRLNDVSK